MKRALPLPDLRAVTDPAPTAGEPPRVVSEAPGSSVAWCVQGLVPPPGTPLLLVTDRGSEAHDLQLDLACLAPDRTVSWLQERADFDPKSAEARRLRSDRERVLRAMRGEDPELVVVASLRALAEEAGDPKAADQDVERIREGDKLDLERLRHRLFDAGLDPATLVSAPGEFSLRGDILDVFPFGADHPVRLELFDDEVESLRRFDPETQRSTEQCDEVEISFAGEGRRQLVQRQESSRAVDHFANEPWVVRIDPEAIRIEMDRLHEAAADSSRQLAATARDLERWPCIDLHPGFREHADVVLGARRVEGCNGLNDIGRWAGTLPSNVRALHLFSNTAAEGKRLSKLLRSYLPTSPRRAVHDQRGSLTQGFVIPEAGIWVGNHHELLSRTRWKRVEKEAAATTRPVREALELSAGDYVVHLTHGVGLYRGTKEHQNQGGTEDYLILEYDGGTLLYVPSSKVDLLSRYIGAGGAPPRLDKIGGRSWSKKKAAVEAALDEVADDLLELQAKRQTRPGHAFEPDDELQAEFEASFPYADTEDQVTAIEDIKRDMQAPRSMDRLLCGDVGFGKTEVAIRAAFKAAAQGKQVAVLAPTTLLVRQHLETFQNRMAQYPLEIAGLSRFTSTAKAKDALEKLRTGKLDVIIGTHRLLSPKVQFRDLGLVIIDEEQRFGVRHKEALKLLKAEVDVLTLSATPIPRTMHMSLVGLRDISTLRQPPRGRQAIETVVTYDQDDTVRHALERELARDGQVFYLFNRVQGIERAAERVMRLAPAARVGIAHGQMSGTRLESAANSLQRGKVDVLVCTSIIESGIDIPQVNTLIVQQPELLGLSDLHQLRGRIGRSDRQAYAYFLLPRKPLPATALKRLRALEGLSHLGAGFDVAIRDLEIRGAGNLLGSQQSGHIEAVGYELYCRLLNKVVSKRRGKAPPPEPEEIDVNLGLPAFLPREYIHSSHQRMGVIRRMGESRKLRDLEELEEELRDRFGRLPPPARHLFDVLRLKLACRRFGIARMFYPGAGEVLLNVNHLKKFAKAPLGSQEARWVEGQRVILALPPRVNSPEEAAAHLRERFLEESSRPRKTVVKP